MNRFTSMNDKLCVVYNPTVVLVLWPCRHQKGKGTKYLTILEKSKNEIKFGKQCLLITDVTHRFQNFVLSSILSENMFYVIVMEWLKKEKINNNSKRVSDQLLYYSIFPLFQRNMYIIQKYLNFLPFLASLILIVGNLKIIQLLSTISLIKSKSSSNSYTSNREERETFSGKKY